MDILPPLIGVIGSDPAPTENPSEATPCVTPYGVTTAHRWVTTGRSWCRRTVGAFETPPEVRPAFFDCCFFRVDYQIDAGHAPLGNVTVTNLQKMSVIYCHYLT